jgi:hypothetical protein
LARMFAIDDSRYCCRTATNRSYRCSSMRASIQYTTFRAQKYLRCADSLFIRQNDCAYLRLNILISRFAMKEAPFQVFNVVSNLCSAAALRCRPRILNIVRILVWYLRCCTWRSRKRSKATRCSPRADRCSSTRRIPSRRRVA